MLTLWQDLNYGARMLMKRPGLTIIANTFEIRANRLKQLPHITRRRR